MATQDFKPAVLNMFCADGGFENEYPRSPISIRCPHCRELGSFAMITGGARSFRKRGTKAGSSTIQMCYASMRVCPNVKCLGIVFIIEQGNDVVEIEPPELLDFNPEGLPPRLQQTLREAVACHGAGAYRAAAMMVRRLLEEICEANDAKGSNLHQRLAALRKCIVLPEPLFDAMSEHKALGNDAAHIEAISYDNIGAEESQDSIELAKEIVKSLYQLKGLISRLQARKAAQKL